VRQIPNAITVLRALCAAAVVGLLMSGSAGLALTVFALAATTDAIDGWLARRLGATSDLGAFLDPLADKILVAGTLGGLVAIGAVDGAAVSMILGREALVTTLRALALARGSLVTSSIPAKVKAGLQGVAVAAQLTVLAWPTLGIAALADGLLWVAALATVATGVDVVRRAAAALALPPAPVRAHAR
jgi:CDP-diacylglycerol--glycerol-3-phosphate 3-phosphatidyltransferase